ncbi:hypothetical protein PHMEG_00024050 [Phytophthora megakarya]|uniref:Jacalin-type lectin domain-containing protein n=1 Tax=Phytophthora megakarya TaxID=4795 RepID=A0A225VEM4_9STRA|nr:hypothetical protein PHMEG_00024050 [Phytophthora megakarya]
MDSTAASTENSAVTSIDSSTKADSTDSSTAGSAPQSTKAPSESKMTVEDSIQLSKRFGGPHGTNFSDQNFVDSGQNVSTISIHAGERLDGITMEISSPKALTYTHGGTGKPSNLWKANTFHPWKGNNDEGKTTLTAPEGFQLAGFYGSEGKEIDSLGAIWASIQLVTPPPTRTPTPSPIY